MLGSHPHGISKFQKKESKQAKLGVPHSKSKLSGPNQIHLASWNLLDFQGGYALDGKTNKQLATTDRHRRGDAPDGKTNKH